MRALGLPLASLLRQESAPLLRRGAALGAAALIACGTSASPPIRLAPSSPGPMVPQSAATTSAPLPTARRAPTGSWRFTDVTRSAGFDYVARYTPSPRTGQLSYGALELDFASGVAAGDFDGDGWVDLFVVAGNVQPYKLFRNRGDGSFQDVAAAAGVAFEGGYGCGPVFADFDGDGHLDLLIGGVDLTPVRVLKNLGQGTFADQTLRSNLGSERIVVSSSFGDYDSDGDLDLAWTRWGGGAHLEHLYQNDGTGVFTPAGKDYGINGFGMALTEGDYSFAFNFTDLDDDGKPDLTMSSDFHTTRYYMNRGGGHFDGMRPPVIDDGNGMGSAIGDFDNDGKLDWFVTSIFDPEVQIPPATGNRLYRNIGNGQFEDVSARAGVREGFWGWGACFADFNNDGFLDIFHVDGMPAEGQQNTNKKFETDPSRLFISNGDGTFSERSAALGLVDTGMGRGVVCFDYDRDGDVDIFITNSGQPPELWRNDLDSTSHHLEVKLRGRPPNTEAIGARIYVTAGGMTQLRELRAGSNYVSQDPAIAHFGLADADHVDSVRVVWPDRHETLLTEVPLDGELVVTQ